MSMRHDILHKALIGITDRDTKKSYRRSVNDFCAWLKGVGVRKFRDMKGKRIEVINAYSAYLQERGFSSGSVHTYLAPVCKGLGIKMQAVKKPKRRAGDVTKRRVAEANLRGRREAQQDRYRRSVEMAKATGARRAELKKITYRDLMATDESGYRCVSIRGGKGGKDTLQRLTPEQVAICDAFVKEALNSGLDLDDRVLMPAEVSNQISYHSYRDKRARDAYYQYLLRIASEGTDALVDELINRWNACHKDVDKIFSTDGGYAITSNSKAASFLRTLNKKNDMYELRGDNRLRALSEGRPITYNRLALLAVSVFELSHWRVDVTTTYYML